MPDRVSAGQGETAEQETLVVAIRTQLDYPHRGTRAYLEALEALDDLARRARRVQEAERALRNELRKRYGRVDGLRLTEEQAEQLFQQALADAVLGEGG